MSRVHYGLTQIRITHFVSSRLVVSIVSCRLRVNSDPSNPFTVNGPAGYAVDPDPTCDVIGFDPIITQTHLYQTLTRFILLVSVSSWRVILEITTLTYIRANGSSFSPSIFGTSGSSCFLVYFSKFLLFVTNNPVVDRQWTGKRAKVSTPTMLTN